MTDIDLDGDFTLHAGVASDECRTRAREFVRQFSMGILTTLSQNEVGFAVLDADKRQPTGSSCFFACAVAAARGIKATDSSFQQLVGRMVQEAQEMGIVNQDGVVPMHNPAEITKLLAYAHIEHETIAYTPNSMTADQIVGLGIKIADSLTKNIGIAMLIPGYRHYVLLHSYKRDMFVLYDPFQGADYDRSLELVGSVIGNIVNGQMQGQTNSRNSLTFFKPESDFEFNAH